MTEYCRMMTLVNNLWNVFIIFANVNDIKLMLKTIDFWKRLDSRIYTWSLFINLWNIEIGLEIRSISMSLAVFPTVAMPWQMWPYSISSGHEFFSFMASHISPQKVQNVAIFDFAKFFGHIWAFSYKFWPFLANSYRFWKISFDFHLISKIRKILYWNFQKYNDLKMQ